MGRAWAAVEAAFLRGFQRSPCRWGQRQRRRLAGIPNFAGPDGLKSGRAYVTMLHPNRCGGEGPIQTEVRRKK